MGQTAIPWEVRDAEIGLPQGAPHFSHQLSPAAVVALASQLYGASPRAFRIPWPPTVLSTAKPSRPCSPPPFRRWCLESRDWSSPCSRPSRFLRTPPSR